MINASVQTFKLITMQKTILKLYSVLVLVFVFQVAKSQSVNEEELKIEVSRIENSTVKLKNLQPVTFKYNVDKYSYLKLPTGNQYGFMVENVEQVFPAMVYESSIIHKSNKGSAKVAKYKDFNKDDLIPVLVEALKEQQEQIDALKKELQQLKSKKS